MKKVLFLPIVNPRSLISACLGIIKTETINYNNNLTQVRDNNR